MKSIQHRTRKAKVAREVAKFVYWRGKKLWVGYLQEYPDYWTQGESLDDLKEHLRDLYRDITSGELPFIRKVEELVIS